MLAAQACGGDQAATLRIILRGAKPNESAGSVFDQVRACHQLEVHRRGNQAVSARRRGD
jgi:hypothetical protein